MHGQIIELIFFGIVAFLVINKLIAILGTTNLDEDKNNAKSFFGESGAIKDVTISDAKKTPASNETDNRLNDFILKGHEEEVKRGLAEALEKIPNFNIKKFIKGSKIAFDMIFKSAQEQNEEDLKELIDKRYLAEFAKNFPNYGAYNANDKLEARISEIYSFGNNIFIKVLFFGKGMFEKIGNFHEEWTFSKNGLEEGPNWYLTNIDKSH